MDIFRRQLNYGGLEDKEISPYIFLIVMNVLLEQIKQNSTIKGIKTDDVEYKVSAYADDTQCYLDGSVNSCRFIFEDLGRFAKNS